MLPSLRQIRELATPQDRREAGVLAVVVTFASALETVAVGSLLPFMAALADPEALASGGVLPEAFSSWLGPDPSVALQRLGVAVLVLLVVSSMGSVLTSWLVQRFVWGALHRLATRLLLRYLRQPYAFFLGRNTSDLARSLLNEVDLAMTGVVLPLIHSLVRAVPAVLILGLLVVVDPAVALGAGLVLAGAYGVAYLLVQGPQSRAGARRVRANEARFRAAYEGLSGIKTVKAQRHEDVFSERFQSPSRSYAEATAGSEFLSLIPRYIVEAVAFGGMILLVLVLLARGEGLPGVLPLIGLYAFAGYRLLPSLQQIFLSMTRARFHEASIQQLHEDLLGGEPEGVAAGGEDGMVAAGGGSSGPAVGRAQGESVHEPGPSAHAGPLARDPSASPPAVSFEDVHFTYPGAGDRALNGITFDLESGRSYGLIGPSGAGKTTVADLVLGLLSPDAGEVRVMGMRPGAHPRWGPGLVGYVPQDVFLVDASLAANVALGVPPESVDRDRVRELLSWVELDELVDQDPAGLDAGVGERGVRISGGQRQRIGLARALYPDPEILLLDEGTSALDGATEARILARLLERGKTLVMVAHRLQSLRDTHEVLFFRAGRLQRRGPFADLLQEEPEVRAMAREASDAPVAPSS